MKKSRFNRKTLFILLGIYVLLLIVLGEAKVSRLTVDSDFGTFWSAGKDFFAGNALYAAKANGRNFIYPPFAAMFFQVFGLLPLAWAARLFYVVNGLIFPLAIWLLYAICRELGYDKKRIRLPLILTTIFSAKYFWDNQIMLQVNGLILVLSLSGILWVCRKKYAGAVYFFLAGTALKLIPVIFSGHLLFRKHRIPTVWYSLLLGALLCIGVPILQRGPQQGLTDIQEYYNQFLQPFQEGKVLTVYTNQNLSAALTRMFRPTADDLNLDYQWFSLSETHVQALISTLSLLLLLVLLGQWVYLKKKTASPEFI